MSIHTHNLKTLETIEMRCKKKINNNHYKNKVVQRSMCTHTFQFIFVQDFFTKNIWYDSYISLEDEQLEKKMV
jgi:hypothetical protein